MGSSRDDGTSTPDSSGKAGKKNNPLPASKRTLETAEEDLAAAARNLKPGDFVKEGNHELPYPAHSSAGIQSTSLSGPLRCLATTAPTVGHARVAVIRYRRHHNPPLCVRLEHQAGQAVLQFESTVATEPLEPLAVENWVVATWRLISELRGAKLEPYALHFRHPSSDHSNKYAHLLGCAVFSHPRSDSIIMSADALGEVSVKHNANLHEMVRFYLEARALPLDGLKGEVEAQIKILLPAQRCTLEQVALALHLNPRTLQRRLAHESIEFEACLDTIRRRQAEQLLRQTVLTVGQISSELGYRRTTSFCRAHQRWFEMTPLEHRRQFGDKAIL